MPPDPSRRSGRLVGGRYVLGRPLGRGGMGTVWSATDEVLRREVAVKEVVPPPGLTAAQRDQLRRRTFREARAAARVSSPSAVTVYDVVEEDGEPWIVMEKVEAPTLASAVRDEGPLPPERVARIGLRLLDALDAAHAAGVLHRDVKPANVLLAPDGRVVLTDFGVAHLDGDPAVTTTGVLVGSPAYLAPERARGERPTPAGDLWSLGSTLWTAVEGTPAFRRGTPMETLTAVLTADLPAPARAGALGPVLTGLLVKDPRRRLDARGARVLLQGVAGRGNGGAGVGRDDATRVLSAADDPTSALPGGERTVAATPASAAATVPAAGYPGAVPGADPGAVPGGDPAGPSERAPRTSARQTVVLLVLLVLLLLALHQVAVRG